MASASLELSEGVNRMGMGDPVGFVYLDLQRSSETFHKVSTSKTLEHT